MKPFHFLLLFSLSVLTSVYSSLLKVDVSAKGAILMNSETGAILYEKNAHTPLYPASTTKIITALYALEKKGHALDEMVLASQDAVSAVPPHIRRASDGKHPPYRLEFGGTHMGIKTGEELSLRTLIYGMMLMSGNDAANVIAQHVSGNVPQFLNEVNEFIRSKGCSKTTLYTPHGLPHPDHKTTAYELAFLTRIAMQNPQFREVVKTVRATRPQTKMQPESPIAQLNALLKKGKFYYPKAIGVKTGYTVSGGYTLVAAAEDEKRKLIAVVLGCDQLEQRYRDAISLFEAAFNETRVARVLFSKNFDLFNCSLKGGKTLLEAQLEEDLVLHYYPSEEPIFKPVVEWSIPPFPIVAGAEVGQVKIIAHDGAVLFSAPVFAAKQVESTWAYDIGLYWESAKRWIWNHIAMWMALLGVLVVASTYLKFHCPKKRKRAKN
jgi:D-alanyl-D-alanine carboxypeptidase (penicillin-binding protein 5/6)